MEEGESGQPAENRESVSKLPPEVVAMLKHGREVYERVEARPSLYPPEYTYLDEIAQEDTTKPTDVMDFAMILDKFPGVQLLLGRDEEKYPVFAMANLRKGQIAFIRRIAERNEVGINEIYRRDRATVEEILKEYPELLNPYEVSQALELKEKVSSIVGQEKYEVFMKTIIPNVVFARRLWEIATDRLS